MTVLNRPFQIGACAVAIIMLASCGKKDGASADEAASAAEVVLYDEAPLCSSEVGVDTLKDLVVQKFLNEGAAARVRSERLIGPEESFEDLRKHRTAKLRSVIAVDMIVSDGYNEAAKLRSCKGRVTVDNLGEMAMSTTYTIQVQEDRKNIIVAANFDTLSGAVGFNQIRGIQDVLLRTMFHDELVAHEAAKAASEAEADKKLLADSAAAASAAAAVAASQAAEGKRLQDEVTAAAAVAGSAGALKLETARADHGQVDRRLNAAWSSLAADVKAKELPKQRAWVASRDASCADEARANVSQPAELVRLECETSLANDRIAELQALAK